MKVVMLVTWLQFGQPAHSYQVGFTSMASCEAAAQSIRKDAELVNAGALAAQNRFPYYQVSVVCAAQ
jgi:hypothetical protein